MERVVGRSELYGSEIGQPSSRSASPDPEALERFKKLKAFDLQAVQPSSQNKGDSTQKHEQAQISKEQKEEAEDDEEGLDFRLFAPAATTTPTTAGAAGESTSTQAAPSATKKIRLSSPSLDRTNAGFINPHRDQSYYFTSPASRTELLKEFSTAALSGEDILGSSRSYWPGASYPWKCLRLSSSAEARSIRTTVPSTGRIRGFERLIGTNEYGDDGKLIKKRRTRLGKKSRIKIRVRAAAALAKAEARKKGAEEKEEAEREKRNKRNREKKIKKRARDRARKAEAAAGGGQGNDVAGDNASEDDESDD